MEWVVLMGILVERLRERARQLGISNAEAARRAGLDERRYAHYASGRRQPNLQTLLTISNSLGTTPNWLLGVVSNDEKDAAKAELVERFKNAARAMTAEQLETFIIQAEAIAISKR